ncbi:MAG: carboxypeptidase-like regulatory domain-containing protein [Planctomycetota bacterium]
MLAFLSALAFQWIQPEPAVVEVGREVRVVVVDAAGRPQAGIEVAASDPHGVEHRVGTTDHNGSVTILPDEPGDWRLHAKLPGVELAAPIAVLSGAPRTVWGVFGVAMAALGLSTALASLRTRAKRERDPHAA